MNTAVIHGEGLGKEYRRGLQVDGGLRHALEDFVRSPIASLRRKREETFWALKDVSLEVKEGEVLGLIGRNGARRGIEIAAGAVRHERDRIPGERLLNLIRRGSAPVGADHSIHVAERHRVHWIIDKRRDKLAVASFPSDCGKNRIDVRALLAAAIDCQVQFSLSK